MKHPKVYRYTDDSRRIELRATFSVTGDDVAGLLCSKYADHDVEDDGELPELTLKQVVDGVRLERSNRGEDWWAWSDDRDEERVEALRAWARATVRRVLPDLPLWQDRQG
ncbi:hypothetical protein AB0A05_27235 [Streptomyces sp. NPDC046374]|uniref:hypothetical protein n=1 Tax=Streptomyces sp. NPDC046374 TaxID=3154917 RepID=UPI0033C732E8